MGLAMEQARLASEHGDVPIGAVILDAAGSVVAAAGNERELRGDPTAHAEIVAIREAARRLKAVAADRSHPGGDARAVHDVRRARWCWPGSPGWSSARTTPRRGAVASLFDVVRDARLNHRVDVRGGIREAECGDLLQEVLRRAADPGATLTADLVAPPEFAAVGDGLHGPCKSDGSATGDPDSRTARSFGNLPGGGVSERPKERASKAREGESLRGFKSRRHRQLARPNAGPTARWAPAVLAVVSMWSQSLNSLDSERTSWRPPTSAATGSRLRSGSCSTNLVARSPRAVASSWSSAPSRRARPRARPAWL